jgi:hypothetical protein
VSFLVCGFLVSYSNLHKVLSWAQWLAYYKVRGCDLVVIIIMMTNSIIIKMVIFTPVIPEPPLAPPSAPLTGSNSLLCGV